MRSGALIRTVSFSSRTHSLCAIQKEFEPLLKLSSELTGVVPNTTQTLLDLISLGDRWRTHSKDALDPSQTLSLARVPGCMADTRIYTRVEDQGVVIAGGADSRVAQGMLALLSEGLRGVSLESVAALDVDATVAACSVSAILPPGRFNGFRNMLHLIRDQAQWLTAGTGTSPTGASPAGVDPPQFTEQVALLLSGGVDSSVALKLLLDQGYTVRAFYLKIWLEDEIAHLNECPWEEGNPAAHCDHCGTLTHGM